MRLGKGDGARVGLEVGCKDGALEGLNDGLAVGSMLGRLVGHGSVLLSTRITRLSTQNVRACPCSALNDRGRMLTNSNYFFHWRRGPTMFITGVPV